MSIVCLGGVLHWVDAADGSTGVRFPLFVIAIQKNRKPFWIPTAELNESHCFRRVNPQYYDTVITVVQSIAGEESGLSTPL